MIDEEGHLSDVIHFAKDLDCHFSCTLAGEHYIRAMTDADRKAASSKNELGLPSSPTNAPLVTQANFRIGDVVRHRSHGFRGIIFDVDPVFANSEEWYEAIPEDKRPLRNQPFYHLFAENEEGSYIAYVSQQNLVDDGDVNEPVHHPAISHFFQRAEDGSYRMRCERWH